MLIIISTTESRKRRRELREWFCAIYERLQEIEREKFPQNPQVIDNATATSVF